jgi:AcrR family transcriptional regulator
MESITDEVQQDILTMATVEFVQHGLAGARIDAIAAKTKTSKRMIYYHFGNKEALYFAVLENEYRKARLQEIEGPFATMPPMEALRMYVGQVFDVHCNNPDFVRLVMIENIHMGRFIQHSNNIRNLGARSLKAVENILLRGIEAGVMNVDVEAMEVYTNMTALSFYHVSNQFTFSTNFGVDMASKEMRETRRASIVKTIEGMVAI